MERHDRSRVARELNGRSAMSAKRSVNERKMSTMTHSLFSPDSDAANSSDGHNSSKLDVVQTNTHGAEITTAGGSTGDRSYALPQSEGFALSTMSIGELADQCMNEINHYQRGVLFSERYYGELLFRAILQGDQGAWKAVQQCLAETMRGWLKSSSQKRRGVSPAQRRNIYHPGLCTIPPGCYPAAGRIQSASFRIAVLARESK